jgi:hypothetical protein
MTLNLLLATTILLLGLTIVYGLARGRCLWSGLALQRCKFATVLWSTLQMRPMNRPKRVRKQTLWSWFRT